MVLLFICCSFFRSTSEKRTTKRRKSTAANHRIRVPRNFCTYDANVGLTGVYQNYATAIVTAKQWYNTVHESQQRNKMTQYVPPGVPNLDALGFELPTPEEGLVEANRRLAQTFRRNELVWLLAERYDP